MTSAIPVVSQLADLFWNLEYCEDPAVKPSIELAKLALVTSKDEEEEEGEKAGTDSSNDTDVTLVEDGSTRVSAPSETITASPVQTSFSILGKRSRGTASKMDIDAPDADKDKDYVIVSKPGTPVQTPEELPPDSQTTTGDDVEMSEIEKPGPAVPVRKGTTGMMFGKTMYSSCTILVDFPRRSATRRFRMHGLLPFPTRMCGTDSLCKTVWWLQPRHRQVEYCEKVTQTVWHINKLLNHIPGCSMGRSASGLCLRVDLPGRQYMRKKIYSHIFL